MKRVCVALLVLFAVSACVAAGFGESPESSVPTPAESGDAVRNVPDIGAKENADWQKLREERREAREQILQRLRNSAEEKDALRENAKVQKKEKAAAGAENSVVPPHERNGLNPMINPSVNKEKEHPLISPPGQLKDEGDKRLEHGNAKSGKNNLKHPGLP